MNIYQKNYKDVSRTLFRHDNNKPAICITCNSDEFSEFLAVGVCDNCVSLEIDRINRNKIR